MRILLLFITACAPSLLFAQQKLFPIEKNGKWGYMDKEGKLALPFQYDYADEFMDGMAVVAVKNLPCIINTDGKRVIDTGSYQFISSFGEGMAVARTFNNEQYYIDANGEKIITLTADVYEARKMKNGAAVVSKKFDQRFTRFGKEFSTLSYKFAFINNEGIFITEYIFDDADDMIDGIARVKQGGKFGIINNKGEWIVKPTFGNIGNFNEGKVVVESGGKYGFVNSKGYLIIKPDFDYAFNFSEGLAGVWIKEKYGFIDETGTVKIMAKYDQIKPFAEGKAAVLLNGKWGFINKDGEWVLRNVFDNASVFSEGKCAVLVKRYWGFIDAQGALVIPAEYDAVGSFSDGIADVVYRDMNLYINERGRLLPDLNNK